MWVVKIWALTAKNIRIENNAGTHSIILPHNFSVSIGITEAFIRLGPVIEPCIYENAFVTCA